MVSPFRSAPVGLHTQALGTSYWANGHIEQKAIGQAASRWQESLSHQAAMKGELQRRTVDIMELLCA